VTPLAQILRVTGGINGVSARPTSFLPRLKPEFPRPASATPVVSLPDTLAGLSETLARLDDLCRQGVASESRREYAGLLQAAASRLVSVSTFLLRDEVTQACRNAAAALAARCKRLSEADREDAVQEAVLRVLVRMRNLAEVPIRDLHGYTFMTLGHVLAASVRARSRFPRSSSSLGEDLSELVPTKEPHGPDLPEPREVEEFLESHPHPAIGGVRLVEVYRTMIAAEGKRAVAAEKLQVSLGQFSKLWSAVASLVRSRFKPVPCG
jgi:DNA-directed RNA polymerase specialized sigma24 family protein